MRSSSVAEHNSIIDEIASAAVETSLSAAHMRGLSTLET